MIRTKTAPEPLRAETIAARLDGILEAEFTFIRTDSLAERFAPLERRHQDYLLDWTARVASTNIELGHQFARRATEVVEAIDRRLLEAWALHAMDSYDRGGVRPAMEVIRDLDGFLQSGLRSRDACLLEDVEGVLLHFVQGLAGRKLKLEEGKAACTDSETLFLPAIIGALPTAQQNFRLYKATAAMLWAQAFFGTFRVPLGELSGNAGLLALFQGFENLRLEGCIRRELPGLHRDMQALKQALDFSLPEAWRPFIEPMAEAAAGAADSLRLAREHVGRLAPYAPSAFHGVLEPGKVAETLAARLEKEQALFRIGLQKLQEEQRRTPAEEPLFSRRQREEQPGFQEEMSIEILFDGQPLVLPEQLQGTLRSILQDLGEVPEEYLVPAGPGEYDPSLFEDEGEPDPDAVWHGTYHEEGAFLYSEWDHKRQHYRKNWCTVREKDVVPIHDEFVGKTLHKYGGQVRQLRRSFEAMRDEERLLKRQIEGEDVDLDALVEALADARGGREMSERLYTRMHRSERNIAVAFMVDMSGSTRGWINDAEREALVLLCEALESLGDRYAIYGFSGMSRKRCEIYRVKGFDDAYGDEVRARISGIRPQDYTRMGFAIRHLSRILSETDARTRVLVTLSDGKPDDYSDYHGDYGIEDTRRALIESRRDGIHPYCITIDKEGPDYLPHMYGAVSYTVVDEVGKLPLKVSDIYRRLTR